MDMSIRSIIGVYDYVEDNKMDKPKSPIAYQDINSIQYDKWAQSYQTDFKETLNELKNKINHVTYTQFKQAIQTTVKQFIQATSKIEKFCCVSLVQPGKSQKWVTEVAMTKGFKASEYVCLGEEGANNLEYSLTGISTKDKRFKHIVIVDDGSFSGNQMCNNISAAHRILNSKFGESSTFHILIPYITRTARNKINELTIKGIQVNLYNAEEMPLVIDSVKQKNVSKLVKVLWPQLGEAEGRERGGSTSLYWFDHKMPNSMSFPDILAKGTVTQPKEENRKINIPFLPDVQPPYK